MSGVSIYASPNLVILGVKFGSRPTFEDHVRGIVSRVAQRTGILRLVKRVYVDTSVSLRCYYAFVARIIEYCSSVWGLILNVIFSFSSARCIRWPGCASIIPVVVPSMSCCCTVDVVQGYSLFSELPSASVRVRHTRTAATAHPLEFKVSRCRTFQFLRCFLPAQARVWNDLPYTVFDSRMLDGFN